MRQRDAIPKTLWWTYKPLSSSSEYTYTIIQMYDLQRQLYGRDLLLSTFCTEQNLCFSRDGLSIIPFWEKLSQIKKAALSHMQYVLHNHHLFTRGGILLGKRHNTLSVFMLHQATELCLRAIILAFTGEEVRSHTLADLASCCKRCAPEINKLFQKVFLKGSLT